MCTTLGLVQVREGTGQACICLLLLRGDFLQLDGGLSASSNTHEQAARQYHQRARSFHGIADGAPAREDKTICEHTYGRDPNCK
mmetsp:Transcript_637/g.1661  ORF Transcript_637/g.1661 Transcript_637/m.1661 type:complete len:84 (-) Transcript_637:3821-4072(-)